MLSQILLILASYWQQVAFHFKPAYIAQFETK